MALFKTACSLELLPGGIKARGRGGGGYYGQCKNDEWIYCYKDSRLVSILQ